MYLTIRAFKAINDLDTSLKFAGGHKNVLRDYGIANVTSNTSQWMKQPDVFCLAAEDPTTGEIVGGARIHLSTGFAPLPVETAIRHMDPAISDLVTQLRNAGGVGELCALWNSRRVTGLGISRLLVWSAIAVVGRLQSFSMLSICAGYTLQLFQQSGFVVNNALGNKGSFPYPNAAYRARVLQLSDTGTLARADALTRQRVMELRAQPIFCRIEEAGNLPLRITYNLNID